MVGSRCATARRRISLPLDDVDSAPVRELSHAEAPQAGKRLFGIERLGEHRSRFGEERGLCERGLLLSEQKGVFQRDRRLGSQQLEGDEPIRRERTREEVVFEVEEVNHLALPQDGQAQDRLGPLHREVIVGGEPADLVGVIISQDDALLRAACVVDDRRGDALRAIYRRGLEDGFHDPAGIKDRLGFDREFFIPTQDEASPLRAALLEDNREEGAQKLVEYDLTRDGLGAFGYRVEIKLLGPHRDAGRGGEESRIDELGIMPIELLDLAIGTPPGIAGARVAEMGSATRIEARGHATPAGQLIGQRLEVYEAVVMSCADGLLIEAHGLHARGIRCARFRRRRARSELRSSRGSAWPSFASCRWYAARASR